MKKVVFVTTGAFPVPAVRGGAAEALVEELLKVNEEEHMADCTVVSILDKDAVSASLKYPSTQFEFIQPNVFFICIDHIIHFFAYRVFHLDNHLAFKTMFQRLNYIQKCARYLNAHNFDRVVYENQMALLWTLKYKDNLEKYRGRYYFHLHNHPARYAGNEILAAQCEGILPVSSFIGHAFAEKIGVAYNTKQFRIVKNMVDERIFDPSCISENRLAKLREELKLNDKNVVLYLGRLIPGKGVAELLEAFHSMNRNDTVLLIVGSFNFDNQEHSPYEAKLHGLIQSIGRERVRITGYIEHDEVPAYYALADVAVLPSTCEEAAGLTMMETMLMHRPLITTDMGGIPEYVDSSCAVLLANDENLAKNIAIELEKLLDNPSERERMSRNAAKVTVGWNLRHYYEDFMEAVDCGGGKAE